MGVAEEKERLAPQVGLGGAAAWLGPVPPQCKRAPPASLTAAAPCTCPIPSGQVEEAKWRARQLEKELAEAQVRPCSGARLLACRPRRWFIDPACPPVSSAIHTPATCPHPRWPCSPPQEERDRAQACAAELQVSVEALQAREAASEGQLQQALAAATEENRQLKEQLAVRRGLGLACGPGTLAAACRFYVAALVPPCVPAGPPALHPALQASAQQAEALGEQLAGEQAERQRLDAKVAKHKQVGQRGVVNAGNKGWHGGMPPQHHRRAPALPVLPTGICSARASPAPPPQELEEAEERLRSRAGELDAARAGAEGAGERAAEAEARARELYEENKRLSEHISVGGGVCAAVGWAEGQWH